MTRLLLVLIIAAWAQIIVAISTIPTPTPDQLVFQDMEMGALISYNMATAAHTQGCDWKVPPPPSTLFTDNLPEKLNTDQWCQAISSFGGRYATLVAKHLCGFTLWPSKATTGNFTFDYGTNAINVDVVQQLSESCSAVGVKLGIYYSVNVNAYLNVYNGQVQPFTSQKDGRPRITQKQYIDIVKQQLSELWSNYGDLAEIWFDGGFSVPGMKDQLLTLYQEKQPHAAVFNGCGLTNNAVLWIGSETGHASYPVWNNNNVPADCGGGTGEINGTSYIPKEVDLTLQNSDTWFFDESKGYKSLSELVSIYHDSVGHGGNMLLNLAPPHNSTLPTHAMNLYAALGTFTKECYGVGSEAAMGALAHTSCSSSCESIELKSASKMTFDRMLLKEEMKLGQLITKFQIIGDGLVLFNGTAVGRSLIVLFKQNITVSSVNIKILQSKAPPSFRLIAIPNPDDCIVKGSSGSGCTIQKDVLIGGFKLDTKPVKQVNNVGDCCNYCTTNSLQCVGFWAVPNNSNMYTCTLLKATGGNSKKVIGAFSGSPTVHTSNTRKPEDKD
jgi:alpha-L-fucosidase